VAGREATAKISSILQSSHHKASIMLSLTPLNLPQGKDPGDLTPDEYLKIFKQALNRVRRTL
jgi:hypothetical protein